MGLLYVVFVQHFSEEEQERTRWLPRDGGFMDVFFRQLLSALVPPRVAFTTVVSINAPNICIERHSFTREIPTFPENIRRRQDGRYRLIVSYCGRCYRCNQLLKDGPRDQGSVHPMTLWVKWYHGGNC